MGCCRYLDALVGLRESPFLSRCKRITRLRLQAELYSLTQVPSNQSLHPCCATLPALTLPCMSAPTCQCY